MLNTLPVTHSAEIRMWLDCGIHGTHDLRRVSPKFVEVKDAIDIPPCFANLVIVIDGKQDIERVNLAAGISKHKRRTLALSISDVAPF